MLLNATSFDATKDPEIENAFWTLFKYIEYRPRTIFDSSNSPDVARVFRKVIDEAKYQRRGIPSYKLCTPSFSNYVRMRKEFSGVPWISVHHYLPVKTEEAIEFLENDDVLINHHRFVDIKMDAEDPIPFYTKEVKGKLFGDKVLPKDDFWRKEFKPNAKKLYMFILAGVGGIGWLEFQKMMLLTGQRKFYFLLKDISHVKHFRSLQYVKEDKLCRVMRMREEQWALCVHNSAPNVTVRWDDPIIFPKELEYEG